MDKRNRAFSGVSVPGPSICSLPSNGVALGQFGQKFQTVKAGASQGSKCFAGMSSLGLFIALIEIRILCFQLTKFPKVHPSGIPTKNRRPPPALHWKLPHHAIFPPGWRHNRSASASQLIRAANCFCSACSRMADFLSLNGRLIAVSAFGRTVSRCG